MTKSDRVIIHIQNHQSEVIESPSKLKIEILNLDQFKHRQASMGSLKHGYDCPSCNSHGSEFMWNAATIHTHGKMINCIQYAPPVMNELNSDYTCAYCLSDHTITDILRFNLDMGDA